MSEPVVTYEQDISETSQALVKKVEKDPESNIVEYIEADLEKLEKLKDQSGKKSIFKETEIDLKDWKDPWVNLCLGVKPHYFLKKVLNKGLFEKNPETLKYSELKLSISLMKFLEFSDQNIVGTFSETCEKLYPQILLLMNINGCLVHRTKQQVQFSGTTEYYVKCFKHKMNHHYYREGHMAFLKAVMRHPRVSFAFNSSIMRKNILPIINNMFI